MNASELIDMVTCELDPIGTGFVKLDMLRQVLSLCGLDPRSEDLLLPHVRKSPHGDVVVYSSFLNSLFRGPAKAGSKDKSKRSSSKQPTEFGLAEQLMIPEKADSPPASPSGCSPPKLRSMSLGDIPQALVNMKYAVRGAVMTKAEEMAVRLKAGEALPYETIIRCNIGNPHAVAQKPLTFYRQVAACCVCPSLLDLEGPAQPMPCDVIFRAREYLDGMNDAGVGSYTHSNGLMMVRKQIAAFIQNRDGFACDPPKIALTTGASEGVKRCIQALISDSNDGILIPCPQYPLYSAALTMCGGRVAYYNLDESQTWSFDRAELDRAYAEAQEAGIDVRAIAVINPGNPSGAVMSYEDVAGVVSFARENNIVILADEVYQENVYAAGKAFHSFKKVVKTLEVSDPSYSTVQLVSFHSTSKGLLGECGQRGGYAEFVGFSARTMALFAKVAATSLSPNTLGQVFLGLMVTPPAEDGPSHALFVQERDTVYDGLKRRAKFLRDGLNSIPGLTCNEIEGAMYGFPQVAIPAKAEKAAEENGLAGDEYWCLRLVEEAGVVCVPGSGFGQQEGTYHFRITILPPDDMLQDCLGRLRSFQESFYKEFV